MPAGTGDVAHAPNIWAVEAHIRRLPPLSAAIHEIIEQLRNEDSDIGWLEKHISSDPSLATRLLKMANSAFYGTRFEVYTIPRALMTLGFRTSLNVLLAASMRSAFSVSLHLPGFQSAGFARHSVAVGTCAAALGRRLPLLKPAADKLFVAGLLHDIGRVALAPLYKRFATEILEATPDQPPSPEVERRLLGIDHCAAGAMVIRQWRLPADFAEPIMTHHDPIDPTTCPPLGLGVRAADLYVKGEGYSMAAPADVAAEQAEVLAALRTTESEMRSILSHFEAESEAYLGAVA